MFETHKQKQWGIDNWKLNHIYSASLSQTPSGPFYFWNVQKDKDSKHTRNETVKNRKLNHIDVPQVCECWHGTAIAQSSWNLQALIVNVIREHHQRWKCWWEYSPMPGVTHIELTTELIRNYVLFIPCNKRSIPVFILRSYDTMYCFESFMHRCCTHIVSIHAHDIHVHIGALRCRLHWRHGGVRTHRETKF